MKLMTLEALRARSRSVDKRNKKALASKQLEYRLEKELEDKLNSYLESNDRVLLEVNPRVLGEFLNILDGKLLSLYAYEQLDTNKFVFSSREILV